MCVIYGCWEGGFIFLCIHIKIWTLLLAPPVDLNSHDRQIQYTNSIEMYNMFMHILEYFMDGLILNKSQLQVNHRELNLAGFQMGQPNFAPSTRW